MLSEHDLNSYSLVTPKSRETVGVSKLLRVLIMSVEFFMSTKTVMMSTLWKNCNL